MSMVPQYTTDFNNYDAVKEVAKLHQRVGPKIWIEIQTPSELENYLLENKVILYWAPQPLRRAYPTDSGFTFDNAKLNFICGAVFNQKTGVYLSAPDIEPIDIQIRPRSSALTKHKLMVAVGTVDAGYRGELIVSGYAVTQGFVDNPSIAQLVIPKDWRLIYSTLRIESKRGANGFGSTDAKPDAKAKCEARK